MSTYINRYLEVRGSVVGTMWWPRADGYKGPSTWRVPLSDEYPTLWDALWRGVLSRESCDYQNAARLTADSIIFVVHERTVTGPDGRIIAKRTRSRWIEPTSAASIADLVAADKYAPDPDDWS